MLVDQRTERSAYGKRQWERRMDYSSALTRQRRATALPLEPLERCKHYRIFIGEEMNQDHNKSN